MFGSKRVPQRQEEEEALDWRRPTEPGNNRVRHKRHCAFSGGTAQLDGRQRGRMHALVRGDRETKQMDRRHPSVAQLPRRCLRDRYQ